ncbi:MAG: MscL family protein [Nocardioides sp.]|jgi:large conductance mechanosensitive channel|uniref:MscL family protein n=1 Tax=Nocardioides sp. TaxID=35761 RepID=UPI00263285E4|nr:MscL family protein [Nocardioides sp.]MCW2835597.1 MscL family protein [Nocardioides sp.]
MTGFKNFLLRGNLVELAVAVIMAAAFGAMVTALTAWLTSLIPGAGNLFAEAELGELGFFLNALIAFVVLATIVYFLVVVPYTKAKDRFFPTEAAGTPADVALLEEIRDLLRARS